MKYGCGQWICRIDKKPKKRNFREIQMYHALRMEYAALEGTNKVGICKDPPKLKKHIIEKNECIKKLIHDERCRLKEKKLRYLYCFERDIPLSQIKCYATE